MKLLTRILILTVALALPFSLFAAKGDKKKKNETPAASFATLDKDGDGNITEEEYVAAMKESLGGEEAAKTKFASLDKNHDGKLSKEEFGGASSEKKKRRKKNQE